MSHSGREYSYRKRCSTSPLPSYRIQSGTSAKKVNQPAISNHLWSHNSNWTGFGASSILFKSKSSGGAFQSSLSVSLLISCNKLFDVAPLISWSSVCVGKCPTQRLLSRASWHEKRAEMCPVLNLRVPKARLFNARARVIKISKYLN